jgi:hypothetical protein
MTFPIEDSSLSVGITMQITFLFIRKRILFLYFYLNINSVNLISIIIPSKKCIVHRIAPVRQILYKFEYVIILK